MQNLDRKNAKFEIAKYRCLGLESRCPLVQKRLKGAVALMEYEIHSVIGAGSIFYDVTLIRSEQ